MHVRANATLAPVAHPATVTAAMNETWRTHDAALGGDALDRLSSEWLLTNGTGAFAMGTLPGVNTRRYHGLLVASTHPPVGRIVALNQVLDELHLTWPDGEKKLELTTNLFRGEDGRAVAQPGGHTLLRRFEKGLTARWTFRWRMVELSRELNLHWKRQAVTLRYVVRWLDDAAEKSATHAGLPQSVVLRLLPMVTLRDFHALLHTGDAGDIGIDARDDTATIRRAGHALTLRCEGAAFGRSGQWWYNLLYPSETERGQDDHEDAFVPGAFEIDITPGNPGADSEIILTAALGDSPADPDAANADRAAHLEPIYARLPELPADKARMLAIAADDFIADRTVRGKTLSTILAGFPWFADWGRDTFIALPGLLLETGRFDEARDTLRAFAQSIRNGLVPNRFDDYDESAAHYNTVDASLWFVHAAMRYVQLSKDRQTWKGWLAEACVNIIDAYINGTDNDIKMAGDGLITAGGPHTQLTWMDALCNGVAFTPRHGKAVEINALWYAALLGLAEMVVDTHPQNVRHYEKLAGRMRRAFPKVFWNERADCLYDHVWTDDEGADHPDASIRPNQVFVASLPHSPLPRTKQQQVLAAVKKHLLTPFGLRTLPPDDPHYHARYTGDMFHRDEAYHQGTVWAWLIGPYAEAVLRTGKFSKAARREAYAAIDPLLGQLAGDTLGQLHEIYEADPPHRPAGCIAQAWSIAEVLRVWKLIEGD